MENEILERLGRIEYLAMLGQKKALTTTDAVYLLGISRSHLYKLCCYKKIPHYKSGSGGHTFYDRDELNEWMLHRRIKTDAEIETDAANIVVTGNKKRGATV